MVSELVDDLLFLHSSDHSSLVLVTDLLNEKNYTSWSRVMTIALDEASFKQCRKVNSTLISWMLNSMSVEIIRGFMFASSVKMMWDEIKEQFGATNGPRLYDLRRSLYSVKQNTDSVAVYYNKIKRIWDELRCIKPTTNANDEECMMKFLMGLNEVFDVIHNQILFKDPLPSLLRP
ncbi:hypothetical protein LIER_36564 [Lithospermum erythrorhizon]|uniref:Retrotransposon Copia-like N-terminal domain-containing protein n=1 Tax=Lithospermum erythrorhizon TaxID=34254 RepID=A0AAV3PBJ1_LITER